MRSPRTATKSSPRSLRLEKARGQQQRPNATKNKLKKKKKSFTGFITETKVGPWLLENFILLLTSSCFLSLFFFNFYLFIWPRWVFSFGMWDLVP